MGLFSFLTRRSAGDKSSTAAVPQLKSQAYDSTVAALPPILGTYPVAGNGPNVLDQLQRAARKRSEAQLSIVEPEGRISSAAPSPRIARFRGALTARPSTAPNAAPNATTRPKSGGRGASGSQNGAWPPGYDPKGPPPVPSIPSHHRRNSSLDSFRGRGFVDVLDAQGEFRPSDFRSRVKAAGARDYGEDVAERNMREHGLDPNNPAARVFYDLGGLDAQLNKQQRAARTASIRVSAFYEDRVAEEELDETAPPPVIARGELSKEKNRLRRKSTRDVSEARPKTSSASPSPWEAYSRSREMLGPEEDRISNAERRPRTHHSSSKPSGIDASLASRRRSFNTHAPAPTVARSKPRPLSLNPSVSNFSTRTASPPPIPQLPNMRHRVPDNIIMDKFLESELLVKKRKEERPRTRHSQKSRAAPSLYSQASDEYQQSRRSRKRESYASTVRRLSSADSFLQGGIGRVDVDSVVDDAFDSPAPSPHIPIRSRRAEPPPLTRPESNTSLNSYYGHARGEHSHPLSRPSSSSSLDHSLSRTRSLGGTSIPGKPRLDDITEHIPVRTSSLGLGVQAPVTPTTLSSQVSSNPLRPQSQHTTNTSVDTSLPATSVKQHQDPPVSGSLTSGADPDAYFTAAEDGVLTESNASAKAMSPVHQPIYEPSLRSKFSGSGNVDVSNYASLAAAYSEGESDSEKPVVGEEGLLFDEFIYGDLGRGLPGLFDAISGPSSPNVPQTPKDTNRKSTSLSIRSTPRKSRRVPNLRQSHSTAFSYSSQPRLPEPISSSESDAFDSLSDSELEYLRQQAFARPPDLRIEDVHGRMSMYGLEEEDEEEEKVDARTAARLRKELKRHKRRTTSGARHRSRTTSSSRRRGDDYEGHAADTEDSG